MRTDPAHPRGRSPRRRGRPAAAAAAVATAAVLVAGAPASAEAASPPVPSSPHYSTGLKAPDTTLSPQTGLSRLATSAAAAGGAVRAAAALPPAVDLSAFAVPPGDQGQHSSCASWATAYTIGGWESNYTHHAGAPFEPMFVYNQVNFGEDAGSYFDDNFAVLSNQGDMEAADWTHPVDDYLSQPTSDERADASLHKMTPDTTLFVGDNAGTTGRTAIQTALANNQPVALGIPIYQAFYDLDRTQSVMTAAAATGVLYGYHAIVALGYDAMGVRIENSWGTGWGDHGFATLSWDFVERYVDEAYAAETFAPNGLVPSVTALSCSTVATTAGGWLDVSGLRLLNVDTTRPSSVTFVSVADPSISVDALAVTKTSAGLRVTTPTLTAGEWRVAVNGINGINGRTAPRTS